MLKEGCFHRSELPGKKVSDILAVREQVCGGVIGNCWSRSPTEVTSKLVSQPEASGIAGQVEVRSSGKEKARSL